MAWAALVALAAAGMVPLVVYWQEAPLRAARAEAAAGEHGLALSRVSYFLSRHPEHGDAKALKARLLVHLDRPDEAVVLFEEVGAATAEDLHAWALAYLKQGRLTNALPILVQAVELAPHEVDWLHELAAVRIRLGLLEEAIPVANRLLEIAGEEGHAHLFLAAIYNDLGDHSRAAGEYRKVLESSPDGSRLPLPIDEVLRQYGIVLSILGQHERAVEVFERSVTVRPTTVGYVHLGSALSQLGRVDEARKAWMKALDFDPQEPNAREFLAKAALEQKNADEALEWLKPMAERPDLRASTAYLLQRAYLLLKDEPSADKWRERVAKLRDAEKLEGTVDQLLMLTPKAYWSIVMRAYRFARAGNWKQAEDMLPAMMSTKPLDPFVRDLEVAIKTRGELPELSRAPIKSR